MNCIVFLLFALFLGYRYSVNVDFNFQERIIFYEQVMMIAVYLG